MNIRTVQKEDIEWCYKIEKECFEPSEAATMESLQDRANLYPDGFIVAQNDQAVIGMVNSGSTNSDDITDEEFKKLIGHTENGKNLVIFSLSVLPEFQGKGIAKSLMKKFIARARELGKEKILLLCKTGLIPFYEKLGFCYGAISSSTHGGAQWHEMAFHIK